MPQLVVTSMRKCGRRKTDALYVVGGGPAHPDGVLKQFYRFNPPIPYQVKLHRGPRLVSADAIFMRLPMEYWWVGSSKETEVQKAGAAWALENFGMSVNKRINTGECAGCTTADEAMNILANKVTRPPARLVTYFGYLMDLGEVASTTADYDKLRTYIKMFKANEDVGSVLGIVATIWRLAKRVPPKMRDEYIPTLMRMLVLLGLPQDAAAMNGLIEEN